MSQDVDNPLDYPLYLAFQNLSVPILIEHHGVTSIPAILFGHVRSLQVRQYR